MTEEQLNKIQDIRNLNFEGASKEELSNICDLVISIWEFEEDEKVKLVIQQKFADIVNYLLERIPGER